MDYKCGETRLTKERTFFIDKLTLRSQIPGESRKSIMIMLYKIGEKSYPTNYRGINLLCSTLRSTTKLISHLQTKALQLEDPVTTQYLIL